MARPETICFRSSKNPIHLLQLPAELAEIIESRSTCASATAVPLDRADLPPILSVALRGDPKDEAHLVTPNATFLLKSVQTSNSMLLVAPQGGSSAGFQLFSTPGGGSAQYGILETSGSYVEVLPTAAKLSRIKSMLDQAPFRGFDQEDESEALGYTLEDFKSCVQASDAEIGACLDELDAMEIQGRWRLLDTSYTQAVLSAIVDSAVANGMDLGNVDMAEIIAVSLDADYPAEVLQHVFRCFFTPLEKRSLDRWKLNAEKVTVFAGLHLLATKNRMSKGQFLELWRSIPGVDDASLEMLKGFVLVEDAQPRKEDQMIAYFPKTELSLDPATRFRQLFERRQRWSEADFIPFVEDLVPNKKALDTLLLKFARVSSIPGVGGKMITPRFT